ncbi:MAG: mutT [Chlamydiales bacterium]|jgi:ADP-ribose pyrophosphatase|nr:mutT [Chlamydiales bacterium]
MTFNHNEEDLKTKLPRQISRNLIWDKFFKFWEDTLENPENSTKVEYYSLDLPRSAVMILASDADGMFILNNEYRYPTKKFLLSCPGGAIEQGESIIDAAKRELLEETGYTAEEFFLMGSNFPFPGVVNQEVFFVRALKAKYLKEPQLESLEILQTALYSQADIRSRLEKGNDVDGLLCIALSLDLLGIKRG